MKLPIAVLSLFLVLASSAALGKEPAATLSNTVNESQLAIVELPPEAVRRLDLKTSPVERRAMRAARTLGGEIMVPPGSSALVTAPLAGPLALPSRGPPAAGERVGKGEVLFELRATSIRSPLTGVLSAVHAAGGQVVSAGTPLFEVMDTSTLWVKVPIYAGEFSEIDAASPVAVRSLSAAPGVGEASAKPVAGPPVADATTATIPLFYKLANPDGRRRPGERVSVTVIRKTKSESLVAPWSAVLYDHHGDTWVYESLDEPPRRFTRRRIQLERVEGGSAVLVSGPPPGTRVVTDGAAEIFGTEFGAGK